MCKETFFLQFQWALLPGRQVHLIQVHSARLSAQGSVYPRILLHSNFLCINEFKWGVNQARWDLEFLSSRYRSTVLKVPHINTSVCSGAKPISTTGTPLFCNILNDIKTCSEDNWQFFLEFFMTRKIKLELENSWCTTRKYRIVNNLSHALITTTIWSVYGGKMWRPQASQGFFFGK